MEEETVDPGYSEKGYLGSTLRTARLVSPFPLPRKEALSRIFSEAPDNTDHQEGWEPIYPENTPPVNPSSTSTCHPSFKAAQAGTIGLCFGVWGYIKSSLSIYGKPTL